jgi:hypothetical protein
VSPQTRILHTLWYPRRLLVHFAAMEHFFFVDYLLMTTAKFKSREQLDSRDAAIDYRCDDEKKLLSWCGILVSLRS